MSQIIAVIQARNGNDRLPGKGSLPLLGKPMLYHVIERVKRAKTLDGIVVAIPGREEDKPLFEVIAECGVIGFVARPHGIEDWDIVSRYAKTATLYGADYVIRIAADNPCIEPIELDSLIRFRSNCNKHLVLNSENLYGTDGFGGELLTGDTWRWLDGLIAKNYQMYREKPEWFWRDVRSYSYVGRQFPSGFCLDVNTQADYEKLKTIYDHFGHNHFTVDEVIEFLNGRLEQRQKSIS